MVKLRTTRVDPWPDPPARLRVCTVEEWVSPDELRQIREAAPVGPVTSWREEARLTAWLRCQKARAAWLHDHRVPLGRAEDRALPAIGAPRFRSER